MISLQDVIYYLLIFEVLIILGFLILIPFHRLYCHYKTKNDTESGKEMSESIINSLIKGKSENILETLKKYSGSENLLKNLEKFDRLVIGSEWEEVKNKVTELYLLPNARRYASAYSWMKRNFAARCFVLTAKEIDEDTINQLAKDPHFLVSSVASVAAVKFENRDTIYEMIRKMGREKGYARYFYRDLLSKQNNAIFTMIQELAETDKDPKTHLACLELLTEKTIIRIPSYLEEDLISENLNIRLNAVKIIARNPQEKTKALLMRALEDKDPEIRAEAIHGFQYFPSAEVLKSLENLMKDNHWPVRLTAAQILWKMGKKGKDILVSQDLNDAARNILQHHGG